MNKLSLTKFIIINSFLIFLCIRQSAASSLFIEKEPYSIDKETRYKNTMTIAFLPLGGNVDKERENLKDVIKSLIKDAVLSYKKYRMPDTIIDYERSAFDVSTEKNIAAPEAADSRRKNNPAGNIPEPEGTGFLYPQFIDENQIEKLNAEMKKPGSAGSIKADIVISGEINQKDDDITVNLEVYNNLYAKNYIIKANGNIKNIDKLNDDIFPDIIKSIIIDFAYLDITSSRKDAMIYIDGRYFGRTDKYNLIIESGYHEIKIVKDNFPTETTALILKKEESKSIEIDLDEKGSASVNKINITTTPEKARIYLDSTFAGYSPVQIENLAPGNYRLRADLQGHVTKFQTLKIYNNTNLDIGIELKKGENKDYYFTHTSIYNNFFKASLFGCTAGILSFMYFGMKIEDEKAKVRGFTYVNPSSHTPEEEAEYARLKKNTDARINKFTLYKSVSTYSAIGFLISAGIFYYLDISQYDIDVAFYNPDFFIPQRDNSGRALFIERKDIGVRFSLRF